MAETMFSKLLFDLIIALGLACIVFIGMSHFILRTKSLQAGILSFISASFIIPALAVTAGTALLMRSMAQVASQDTASGIVLRTLHTADLLLFVALAVGLVVTVWGLMWYFAKFRSVTADRQAVVLPRRWGIVALLAPWVALIPLTLFLLLNHLMIYVMTPLKGGEKAGGAGISIGEASTKLATRLTGAVIFGILGFVVCLAMTIFLVWVRPKFEKLSSHVSLVLLLVLAVGYLGGLEGLHSFMGKVARISVPKAMVYRQTEPQRPAPQQRMLPKVPTEQEVPPGVKEFTIKQPRIIKKVLPKYPPEAGRLHRTGKVIIQVLIGKDGRVRAAEILKSDDPIFDKPSLDAAKQFVYERPTTSHGEPVEIYSVITFNFSTQ